jgi:hypothetical protein
VLTGRELTVGKTVDGDDGVLRLPGVCEWVCSNQGEVLSHLVVVRLTVGHRRGAGDHYLRR